MLQGFTVGFHHCMFPGRSCANKVSEHSIRGYNWGKGGDNSVNITVCQVN